MLDDGSTDNSVAVAEGLAQQVDRELRVVQCDSNGGNVFTQWQRAAQLANGELLWIAEADDSAKPQLLSVLSEAFTENTALAFCDSVQIGGSGEHLSNSYQHYYASADPSLFLRDFNLDGQDFVVRVMAVRNVIMNVSSVLWDKSTLLACFDSIADELPNYQLVGDWRVYLEMLNMTDASVAFVADALNIHRRHNTSVTQTLDTEQHMNEISAMHRHVLANFPVNDNDMQYRMDACLNEIAEHLDTIRAKNKAA